MRIRMKSSEVRQISSGFVRSIDKNSQSFFYFWQARLALHSQNYVGLVIVNRSWQGRVCDDIQRRAWNGLIHCVGCVQKVVTWHPVGVYMIIWETFAHTNISNVHWINNIVSAIIHVVLLQSKCHSCCLCYFPHTFSTVLFVKWESYNFVAVECSRFQKHKACSCKSNVALMCGKS